MAVYSQRKTLHRPRATPAWPLFAYNDAMSTFEVPPKPPKRDQQVRIMMSKDEKRTMRRAAKELDITASDLIRTALHEFLQKKSKRKG